MQVATSALTPASSGLVSSLAEFWASWTGTGSIDGLSGGTDGTFRELASRAFTPGYMSNRAELCADGTPVEFSVALDSHGQVAARFVCDVADARLELTELRQSLRDAAKYVIPSSWSCTPKLDELFARHLSGVRSSTLFKMWHGAGVSPGKPVMGKLYFNCEWLSQKEVLTAISVAAGEDAEQLVAASPYFQTLGCAGVGYDFSPHGLHKVKVYVRVPQFDLSLALLEARGLPSIDHERCQELLSVITRSVTLSAPNYVFSLGFLPRLGLQEWKVYLVLGDMYADICSAGSILSVILNRWSFTAPQFDFSGPSRFKPTLLAAGVDGQREMASLYFRPFLPAWPPL